ncbi:hypothetical protein ACJMK2_028621 [Sinanodonta woodiana]|uniref:Cytochrome P450 n=1 Tax=Sinanodonta woodiana TaxID=1069815 RepID=A0ABD3X7N8_SINWO
MAVDATFDLNYLLFICLILLIFSCYCVFCKGKNVSNLPPSCRGWIPWLGCALEFGQSPLNFIENKRKQLGPIFTLYVAGERMTFLTEWDDFPNFFQSSNVDFQKGVQSSVQNVAAVSEKSFFQFHTSLHDIVKGRLASSMLEPISQNLCTEFNEQLNKLGESGSGDLYGLVRESMYKGVINLLFGRHVLPTRTLEEFKEFERHFVVFDEQFEYGARLPPFFIRKWSNSREWLLKLFHSVVKNMEFPKQTEEQTLLQTILQTVDAENSPNFGLLILWASLANAIPITFWTLGFILENQEIYNRLKKDIRTKFHATKQGEYIEITEEVLRSMPYVKCCMLEAIRLRSPGIITRKVIKTFKVKGYTIPEGDRLMVSPYWAHRNPRHFPEPDTFNPDRWLSVDLDKNQFLEGFIAFGGGRYQCPGRQLLSHHNVLLLVALMFMKIFVVSIRYIAFKTMLKPIGVCLGLQNKSKTQMEYA